MPLSIFQVLLIGSTGIIFSYITVIRILFVCLHLNIILMMLRTKETHWTLKKMVSTNELFSHLSKEVHLPNPNWWYLKSTLANRVSVCKSEIQSLVFWTIINDARQIWSNFDTSSLVPDLGLRAEQLKKCQNYLPNIANFWGIFLGLAWPLSAVCYFLD